MRFRYATSKNGKPVKKAVVYTQGEHGINLADVDPDAVRIIERLAGAGFETYIVGGAVRDLILGKKPKDFDIASAASPNQIKKLFRNSRIIGNRFRLVHIGVGAKIFEVATFRSLNDGTVGNTFGTIEEDVLRRDFTLNALFYDPRGQLVVDYVGGVKDMRAKCVRPIIPLKTIFTDDPVRMIRAVKYAATTGFSLPMGVRMKIRAQSALLAGISPSRLTEEIFKIIRSSSAAKIALALESFGLYQYLQPGASKLMKESPAFREKYLATFAGLNQKDEAPVGENLSALVRDYLETIIVWEEDVAENYKKAFTEARSFVLPMNPPRFELDCAVRLVFKAHGVAIKRALYSEKGGRPPRRADGPGKGEKAASGKNAEKSPPEAGAAGVAALGSAAKPKRNRRKRQRAKSAEGGPCGE